MSHSHFTVDGHPIHAHEHGRPNGQLAMFVHGWSSSGYALSPMFPALDRRYRCLAVDLPGYGESPPPPLEVTIPFYADVLAGLARQLSDKPIVYVGHSMGGMIGLTLALRHPGLVERLILLNPTVSGELSLFINMFVSWIVVLERFPVINWFTARLEPYMYGLTDRLMRPSSFAEQSGIDEKEYSKLRADARRPGQGRVRSDCFWAMRHNDLRGKLSQLDVPTLAIWGMEDNTVPLRDASFLSDEMKDIDLRIIPRAGHWPQFEAPEVTNRYIRAFLSTPLKLLQVEF
ncbi:MAG: alpha/beta hydrolase [Anaerolineales bacterium]|nr:alpha/beta hydrolase [Anaerolineales bacterium]